LPSCKLERLTVLFNSKLSKTSRYTFKYRSINYFHNCITSQWTFKNLVQILHPTPPVQTCSTFVRRWDGKQPANKNMCP
jgi:hypothetical protein